MLLVVADALACGQVASEIRGNLQMHLPAKAFTDCSEKDFPENTLFPDINALSVGYDDLVRYLPLILALYGELSPRGLFLFVYTFNTYTVHRMMQAAG